jgi:hypothetical protein
MNTPCLSKLRFVGLTISHANKQKGLMIAGIDPDHGESALSRGQIFFTQDFLRLTFFILE